MALLAPSFPMVPSGPTTHEAFVKDSWHPHTVLCLDLPASCQRSGINIYMFYICIRTRVTRLRDSQLDFDR